MLRPLPREQPFPAGRALIQAVRGALSMTIHTIRLVNSSLLFLRRNAMYLSDVIEERLVACPFCGESFTAVIDCSGGSQGYVEDCPVCCRPILFQLEVDSQGLLRQLGLQQENE